MTGCKITQAPEPLPRLSGSSYRPQPERPRLIPADHIWLPEAAEGRRHDVWQALFDGTLTAKRLDARGGGLIEIAAREWSNERFADQVLARGWISDGFQRHWVFVEEDFTPAREVKPACHFQTKAEAKDAFRARCEESVTPPTKAEDEQWARAHRMSRDRVRELRSEWRAERGLATSVRKS